MKRKLVFGTNYEIRKRYVCKFFRFSKFMGLGIQVGHRSVDIIWADKIEARSKGL